MTTASEVGASDPPSGSTVIAIVVASKDESGSASSELDSSGLNVPAGWGSSAPWIVQAS